MCKYFWQITPSLFHDAEHNNLPKRSGDVLCGAYRAFYEITSWCFVQFGWFGAHLNESELNRGYRTTWTRGEQLSRKEIGLSFDYVPSINSWMSFLCVVVVGLWWS